MRAAVAVSFSHVRWEGSWCRSKSSFRRSTFPRALGGITASLCPVAGPDPFPTCAGRGHGDREGGYAIPFFTRVGGITRAGRDRVRLLDSDLAIIPYSVWAGSMTSLFTSELRLATLSPAGSEYQDGNCRNGSRSHTRRVCPELCAGDGLSWRRVTYAPGPSHKPSKIARFPRRPAPAPRVGRK